MNMLDPYTPAMFRPEPAGALTWTMAAAGVRLPLAPDAADPATLLDAAGEEVLTVDASGRQSDDEAAAIALLVATAINRAAGLANPKPPEDHGRGLDPEDAARIRQGIG